MLAYVASTVGTCEFSFHDTFPINTVNVLHERQMSPPPGSMDRKQANFFWRYGNG
jgi:hypothetical protein